MTSDKSTDLDNLHPDLEGVCPCGRKFWADTKKYAVLHEWPMCDRFRCLEPHEYLRYVRQSTTGITDN